MACVPLGCTCRVTLSLSQLSGPALGVVLTSSCKQYSHQWLADEVLVVRSLRPKIFCADSLRLSDIRSDRSSLVP